MKKEATLDVTRCVGCCVELVVHSQGCFILVPLNTKRLPQISELQLQFDLVVLTEQEDSLHMEQSKERFCGGSRFSRAQVVQGSRQVVAPCLFHYFISFWLFCVSV